MATDKPLRPPQPPPARSPAPPSSGPSQTAPLPAESSNPDAIDLPDQAYRDAVAHLYYRLSELVFGSLVVAYVLGFVAFVAALVDPASQPIVPTLDGVQGFFASFDGSSLKSATAPLRGVGMFLIYLSISITFAGLSTGLYVAYHFTVLPRPTVAYERIFSDYAIALFQAIAFGTAMCLPITFPLLLGIILVIVCWRQRVEFNAFAEKLYERGARIPAASTAVRAAHNAQDARAASSGQREFRKKLHGYLSGQTTLIRRWRATSRELIIGAIILLGCGMALLASGAVMDGALTPLIMWIGYPVIAVVAFFGSKFTLNYGKIKPHLGPEDLEAPFIDLCKHCGIKHKLPTKTNPT